MSKEIGGSLDEVAARREVEHMPGVAGPCRQGLAEGEQCLRYLALRADEPEQYYNLPVERRREILKLFGDAGVRYVFAGHYHRNALARDGALEIVTTGPVGKPLGADPSGFRIVIVTRDSVIHRYYALDSIPDRVPMPR